MAVINDRRHGRWVELLIVPLLTMSVNGAITYGVVTTQLQWLRADLDRQQRQIERIENRLLEQQKAVATRSGSTGSPSINQNRRAACTS